MFWVKACLYLSSRKYLPKAIIFLSHVSQFKMKISKNEEEEEKKN